MVAPLQGDVAWKLEALTPESPKKDGSAEVYLREIEKTPEQYTCDALVIVKTDICNCCFICKQKEKTTKFCRLKQSGSFKDVPICIDCINVFVEYNPTSVFNLEPKNEK